MPARRASQPGRGRAGRRSGLGRVAGVCLLALCLRLAYLWETARGPFGEPSYLPIDARLYHAWAIDWLAGTWPPPQTYYRPPLYTWFVGLVYAVAGPHPPR